MQANPSKSWRTEVLDVVEDHNFDLREVYDAGPTFRDDDHQCDFCGTHLRYTAVIEAEDNQDIDYEVGLDCLEHVMGTGWSHMQDVEREIKNLKEKAKKKRRREEYAEEYGKLINWLETRLEIENDGFLRDMHEILTTGKKKFTQNMRNSVMEIVEETDLDFLREKQERVSQWESKVEDLLDTIIEKDAIEISEDAEKEYPKPRYVNIGRPWDEGRSSYKFVQDVLMYLRRQNRLTEKQMDAMEEVNEDYKTREVWEGEEKGEDTKEEEDPLPF